MNQPGDDINVYQQGFAFGMTLEAGGYKAQYGDHDLVSLFTGLFARGRIDAGKVSRLTKVLHNEMNQE